MTDNLIKAAQDALTFLMDEYGNYPMENPLAGEAYHPDARPAINALIRELDRINALPALPEPLEEDDFEEPTFDNEVV